MTQIITAAERDAFGPSPVSVGYKVDISRGELIGRVLPRCGNVAFGKRNFAARDSRPHSASEGGQTCQIAAADRNRRR
jgi:hypothetical protein